MKSKYRSVGFARRLHVPLTLHTDMTLRGAAMQRFCMLYHVILSTLLKR